MIAEELIKTLDSKPFKLFPAMIRIQSQDDVIGVLEVQLCRACFLVELYSAQAETSAQIEVVRTEARNGSSQIECGADRLMRPKKQ